MFVMVIGECKMSVCFVFGVEFVFDLEWDVDFVLCVCEVMGGCGVDVIFDVVGGDVFDCLCCCIVFGGWIVVVGFVGGVIL